MMEDRERCVSLGKEKDLRQAKRGDVKAIHLGFIRNHIRHEKLTRNAMQVSAPDEMSDVRRHGPSELMSELKGPRNAISEQTVVIMKV